MQFAKAAAHPALLIGLTIVASLAVFVLLPFAVRCVMWLSYLVVRSIRLARLTPPAPIYWFEGLLDEIGSQKVLRLSAAFAIALLTVLHFKSKLDVPNIPVIAVALDIKGASCVDGSLVNPASPPTRVTFHGQGVRVRIDPSAKNKNDGVLTNGKTITVVGQVAESGWFQVMTDDGHYGYVGRSHLPDAESIRFDKSSEKCS